MQGMNQNGQRSLNINRQQLTKSPRANDPRRTAQNRIRYEQLTPPKRTSSERLTPVNHAPPPAKSAIPSKNSRQRPTKRNNKTLKNRSGTREFLLGFFVGLIIFGTAAFVICNALIGLFT